MIRVLLLAESPYLGGITSHLVAVLRAFAGHAAVETVAATLPGRRADDTLLRAARAAGHEVRVLPMSGPWDPRILGRLRRLVRKEKIDLIHTHNYRATLLAEAVRTVPRLNTCHGRVTDPGWRLQAWQGVELRVMRRRRRVVACSEYVRDWLATQGVDRRRVTVVYNGFVPPETDDVPTLDRQALGIAPDQLVTIYAGRLVEGKGLETWIDALGALPEVAGLVAGDGPLRAALASRAAERGADVRFLGAVERPWPYYRLADVAVLPSRMEALPMMLIEAAAFGLPAVATRVGGVPEVVRDGETGYLVEYGDGAGLRDALRRLADPVRRGEFGAAARDRWQRLFSPEPFAAALAEVYGELL